MVQLGEDNQFGDALLIGLFMSALGTMMNYGKMTYFGHSFSDQLANVMGANIRLYFVVAMAAIGIGWAMNRPNTSSWSSEEKGLVLVTFIILLVPLFSEEFISFLISEDWVTITAFALPTGGMWTILTSN